jgi:exonuclease SbcC
MKPVRLSLQAFGPFAGTEVIDFREAVQTGLFGIYGKTGAGKSSIFSGMTFALFGEPAKSEQESSSLRSDHANADLLTEVDFVFDIAEHRYVVRRRPEQVRPKQRGTGETRNAHEAWLFDATGLSLEDISGGNLGKVVAERKTSLVDSAIENLLGYGVDQFRQIVLLPQGRFEAFLAANTKDRLAILRSLFDVSLFRRLTTKMKVDADEAEREVRAERDVCSRRLAGEGFESTDALIQAIDTAEATLSSHKVTEALTAQNLAEAQSTLELARDTERLFVALETAEAEVGKLEVLAPEVEQLAKRVADAGRAQSLIDVEANVREAQLEILRAETRKAKGETAADEAVKREQSAAQTLTAEDARRGEIDEHRRQLESLARHRQTIQNSTAIADVANGSATAFHEAEEAVAGCRGELDRLIVTKLELSENLENARTSEMMRQKIATEVASLTSALKVADSYEGIEQSALVAAKLVVDEQENHSRAFGALQNAHTALAGAERQLAEAQALHLAHRLADGEPCPVCGATQHPAPATGRIENAGLDSAFRDARRRYEDAQRTERDADKKLASARDILAERQTRLDNAEKPLLPSVDLRAQLQESANALKELGQVLDLSALERQMQDTEHLLDSRQRALAELQQISNEAKTAMAVAQSKLAQILFDVPENLRTAEAIEIAIKENQQLLDQRQAALNTATANAARAREAMIAAQRDLKAANDTLEECRIRLEKARLVFDARLQAADLTEAAFNEFKASIGKIDEDRERVEQYQRELMAAKQAVANSRVSVAGMTRAELPPLEERISDATNMHHTAQEGRMRAAGRLEHLTNLREQLAETMARLDALEISSGPLRRLAQLFDGRNAQNLDLETFAIGAMFDLVLEAANLRLGPMTGHRYYLEREVEESGRGRRGLGIRVNDIYTGKSRPTATLSGGESFIAALALALGLADVVESSSGKVQLDTIFIDEGFGSLDAENGTGTLDQVLEVLNKLVSQRRAVGLISHVREVQEAIPNGFYVDKGLSGSTIQTRSTF